MKLSKFAKKRVALTFDDGYKYTDKVLEKLANHHVKATFFLCGDWIEKNPEVFQKIFSGNHEIGNHSYSHSNMTELSEREASDEIDRVQQLSEKYLGTEARWFRFPYGRKDEGLCRLIHKRGMRSVGWTIDSRDWEGIQAEAVFNNVMEHLENGDIILMHTTSMHTVEALDRIIPELKKRGYKIVRMSELSRNFLLYLILRQRKVIV